MLRRALALSLVVLAACGGPKPLSPPVRIVTRPDGVTEKDVKAHLRMDVSGAEEFSLDTDTTLHVVEIAGGPIALWFLSVSAPTGPPIRLPDGRFLLFTADLAPGIYRGPGVYELSDKAAGPVLGVQPNISSAANIRVYDASAQRTYDRLAKPCTLIATKEQRTGSVQCPSLAAEDGKTVSVRWKWELL